MNMTYKNTYGTSEYVLLEDEIAKNVYCMKLRIIVYTILSAASKKYSDKIGHEKVQIL